MTGTGICCIPIQVLVGRPPFPVAPRARSCSIPRGEIMTATESDPSSPSQVSRIVRDSPSPVVYRTLHGSLDKTTIKKRKTTTAGGFHKRENCSALQKAVSLFFLSGLRSCRSNTECQANKKRKKRTGEKKRRPEDHASPGTENACIVLLKGLQTPSSELLLCV